MNPQVSNFIEKNKDRFLERLCQLVRIESVSAQPDKMSELLKCAELEAKMMKEIGIENVQLLETVGKPMVYGDWLHAAGKPTVLIYGHYDVQPPDPLEQWKTPPFELTVKNGNLYGRGTTDNKGQHFTYLCAIEAFLKTVGKLPINVKILIEGEEETGSVGINTYVPKHKDLLACDAVLISDTGWYDFDHPTICYSLRGNLYFEIKVRGPEHDIHSGMFGGMIRNPLQVLSWILAKLKNENEKIQVPHIYDDILEIDREEKEEFKQTGFDEKGILKETGVPSLVSEEGYSPIEGNWIRPALDICGMWGGYQGVGGKTIIPAEAGAKVSIRIVSGQDPKKVEKNFIDYVKSLCPKGVTVEVKSFSGGPALFVDRNNSYLKKVAEAYGEAFDKKMIFKREGASIPVTAILQKELDVPVVLIGLGLPDDRLHSPNEKFSLVNFYGGIKGAALAFEKLAEK